MFVDKQAVLNLLDEAKIAYQAVEHQAVYTIEEMKQLNLPHADEIAKNLFIRDDKKQHFYLISVQEDKPIDLKSLRQKIGSRRLSFASEKDLQEIMGLPKGAVTPFGLLNDEHKRVEAFIDQRFSNHLIGIHPNDNTMTLWLKTTDLMTLLKNHGCLVELLDLG